MTIFTASTKLVDEKEVFGVPVGLLSHDKPIQKEKYEPKNRIKQMAKGKKNIS